MFPVPESFRGHHADEDVARDLTLDAAQAARASSGAKKSLSTSQIKKLLDSRNDREVLEGLRRVTSVCISPLTEHFMVMRPRPAALGACPK